MNVPEADTVYCFCPECGQVAEVTARWWHPGAPDAVEHVATRCVAGHPFRLPASEVTLME